MKPLIALVLLFINLSTSLANCYEQIVNDQYWDKELGGKFTKGTLEKGLFGGLMLTTGVSILSHKDQSPSSGIVGFASSIIGLSLIAAATNDFNNASSNFQLYDQKSKLIKLADTINSDHFTVEEPYFKNFADLVKQLHHTSISSEEIAELTKAFFNQNKCDDLVSDIIDLAITIDVKSKVRETHITSDERDSGKALENQKDENVSEKPRSEQR